jgi:hypothetical protein
MAFGLTSAGPGGPGGAAGAGGAAGPLPHARRVPRRHAGPVAKGELDILLTSASNGEQLAQDGTAHWGQRHDTGRAGE